MLTSARVRSGFFSSGPIHPFPRIAATPASSGGLAKVPFHRFRIGAVLLSISTALLPPQETTLIDASIRPAAILTFMGVLQRLGNQYTICTLKREDAVMSDTGSVHAPEPVAVPELLTADPGPVMIGKIDPALQRGMTSAPELV